jgi:midasin (ATPase involved in ribosome maturation)
MKKQSILLFILVLFGIGCNNGSGPVSTKHEKRHHKKVASKVLQSIDTDNDGVADMFDYLIVFDDGTSITTTKAITEEKAEQEEQQAEQETEASEDAADSDASSDSGSDGGSDGGDGGDGGD